MINSETQKNYLQGASTYFYYNLEVWKTNQQPTSAVQLVAFNYWNSPNKDASPCCQTIVEYSDGLGRLAEKKLRTASGNAYVRMPDGTLEKNTDGTPIQKETNNRWQTSGRKAYNNKGKVYEEHLPYFTNSPLYQGGTQV